MTSVISGLNDAGFQEKVMVFHVDVLQRKGGVLAVCVCHVHVERGSQ